MKPTGSASQYHVKPVATAKSPQIYWSALTTETVPFGIGGTSDACAAAKTGDRNPLEMRLLRMLKDLGAYRRRACRRNPLITALTDNNSTVRRIRYLLAWKNRDEARAVDVLIPFLQDEEADMR